MLDAWRRSTMNGLKKLSVQALATVLTLIMLAGCQKAGTSEETAGTAGENVLEAVSAENEMTEESEAYKEFIDGLNQDDVEVLRKIIEEQNAQGANVNTDLRNSEIYVWDSDGRLTKIYWSSNDLCGTISFEGLNGLETIECRYTQLEGLEVSGCPELAYLDCRSNQLKSLDVSGCKELKWLECDSNMLGSLNVSGCTRLSTLYCDYNQLTALDVSRCTELTWLACGDNMLDSLDVSGCTALSHLDCDDNVTVTGGPLE